MTAVKRFERFFGKLPLAGKFAIKEVLFNLLDSTSLGEKEINYLIAMVVFVIMIIGHGYQLRMGYGLATTDTAPMWARTIGLVYGAVNALVIFAHLLLMGRATKFFFSKKLAKHHVPFHYAKANELIVALVFTLGAQMIFLDTYRAFG